MGEGGHLFWSGLFLACMIWYSTVTVYVAVKGAFDIKSMLENLRDRGKTE